MGSGVARAFPGGRLAHPEGQNEEENENSLRKSKKTWSKFEEKMRKVELLPTRDCEACYGPGRGKYYNLSADKVRTWPVGPLGEAKWLWRFSWYRNNRQQRFVSSGNRCYKNADIIIIIY